MAFVYYDAAEVREAASGKWAAVLTALGVDGRLLVNRHGKCPGCGGKDRFRFDDQDGSGSFICSQGGGGNLSGDGVELLAHAKQIEWKDAVQMLGEQLQLKGGQGGYSRPTPSQVAAEPERQEIHGALQFDESKLKALYQAAYDEAWFWERSPIDPGTVGTLDFLDLVFAPKDKVLIFTKYRSQGQFGYVAGSRGEELWRMGEAAGITAVKSHKLPKGGRDGAWFLCQPVTGRWAPNPKRIDKRTGLPVLSRRSQPNVTRWPYMVLESDDARPELWLSFLALLPLPIVAIYTSGGRSIHALVKIAALSKDDWDATRRFVLPLFTALGADGGALTAVRLTRLPGRLRGRNEQRLLYINPTPGDVRTCEPISNGGNLTYAK